MAEQWLLVLDEGTTSTRAMLCAPDGRSGGWAQAPITQYYPAPGYVEHDAAQIWTATLACARAMIDRAGGADRIAAIGIANQRETVVAWDRQTARPLAPAIVWQDRRTADACAALRDAAHEPAVQAATGLLLDPYFSATKMRWLIDHSADVAAAGDRLALGTVDAWLLFNLTGGLHATDSSNASRTMLLPLTGTGWDAGLADLFGVPRAALPSLLPMAGRLAMTDPALFGRAIPITGMAGDQQAATIGQCCLAPGDTKATYGTGAFILTNMGGQVPTSRHRLLGTILTDIGGTRHYALEGSVFVAGSIVKWLRDTLGLLSAAHESEDIARSVPDNGGVWMLPALAGLGAPHWRAAATGTLTGLTHGTSAAHIVRAALESIAHQCHDLKAAFAADGADWTVLRIDGGMSGNGWVAQDLADLLNVTVERPADVETTARGAAMLAAVGAGLFPSLADAAGMRGPVQRYAPTMTAADRATRLAGWQRLLAMSGVG